MTRVQAEGGRVVEERLSRLEGRYGTSYEDGEDYFEVSIYWADGSEQPDMMDLAGELLEEHGFTSGRMVRRHTPGRNASYLYCEEDHETAREVVEERVPWVL
ncbi:MAG: hypothetical protein ABEJ62_00615 [Candidatus Nanohaloarchaea archaeon]